MKNLEKEHKRAVRVTSMKDAARLLARVLMQLQRGQISESRARSIGYVCNCYNEAFETSELGKRITELEMLIRERLRGTPDEQP